MILWQEGFDQAKENLAFGKRLITREAFVRGRAKLHVEKVWNTRGPGVGNTYGPGWGIVVALDIFMREQ